MENIYYFRESAWPSMSAKVINHCIRNISNKKYSCNIALTGGSSAKLIYEEWARQRSFNKLRNLNIYFTDERCVNAGHIDSNYQMVLKSLFNGKANFYNHVLHRIRGECSNIPFVIRDYSRQLPKRLDVLVLSLGIDGHIASIFSGSDSDEYSHAKVKLSSCSGHIYSRITITQAVIENARKIFVLVNGVSKRNLFYLIRSGKLKKSIPANLIPDKAIWLVDNGF